MAKRRAIGPVPTGTAQPSGLTATASADLSTLFMMCNETTLEEFHEARSTAYVATATVGRRGIR